jgi:hypothetical protein
MTEKVYLHIGPYKTGTTFLQKVLHTNRAALGANGLCVAGKSDAQQLLAGAEIVGARGQAGRSGHKTWDALVEDVGAWAGPAAVISAEILCRARRRDVRRIVSSLAPAEVHVVYMVRDLAKLVPARWATTMRNSETVGWPTYLASVRGDQGAPRVHGQRFWDQQDPRAVLPRWETCVPREHVHVVTVPPPGSEPALLWQRFCQVLDIDPAPYSLDVRRSNESLGAGESEMLRRLNEHVGRDISWATYERWVKRLAARGVLEHRDGQRRFALPVQEHEWLRLVAEEIGGFLEGGYDVTGDLSDLLPHAPATPAPAPDDFNPADAADAAIEVLAAVLEKLEHDGERPARSRARSPGGLRSVAVGVVAGSRRAWRQAEARLPLSRRQRRRPRGSSARSA